MAGKLAASMAGKMDIGWAEMTAHNLVGWLVGHLVE